MAIPNDVEQLERSKFRESTSVAGEVAIKVTNPDGTNVSGGGASSGVADKSAFTPGTTLEQPTGGVYQTTPDTLTNNQTAAFLIDVNRRLVNSLGTLLAGEDLTNNVMKVEERFSYVSYSTAQAAVTIKSGAGFLHTVTILGGTAGAITVWDNTAGSGTAILPAFTPGNVTVPVTLTIDATFATGLTFTTAAATVITFSYR